MDNVYYAVTQTTQQPQGDGHRGDTTELPDVQHTTYSTLASTQAEALLLSGITILRRINTAGYIVNDD